MILAAFFLLLLQLPVDQYSSAVEINSVPGKSHCLSLTQTSEQDHSIQSFEPMSSDRLNEVHNIRIVQRLDLFLDNLREYAGVSRIGFYTAVA